MHDTTSSSERESPAGNGPADVVVYTLALCVHCARAKALLGRRGIAFREIDGARLADFRGELRKLTGGSTVPQVVIDGNPVGGADQLARLDRRGVLGPLVMRERFPIAARRRRLRGARWLRTMLRRHEREPLFATSVVWLDRGGRIVSPPPPERQSRDPDRRPR